MRILLLGKDGQLGRELSRSLAPLGNLTAWGRETADLADLTHSAKLEALMLAARPDVIVNAAAYTAVDKAESDVATAFAVNAESPAVLASAAAKLGALLIHYSTDYVFDGSGTTPWTEDAPTAPLNVYGASKLAGEQAITASACKHFIFRTSWVYAREGGNFAKTMLRLACERDSLSVIDDQIGAPTDAGWLADMTAQVVASTGICAPRTGGTHTGQPSGIYHAACAGEVSWYGYASHLIAKARQMGFPIKVVPNEIHAVSSETFRTAAQRPKNSRLDCRKLNGIFNIEPPHWQTRIDHLLLALQA